jgi:hypothetical protein
MHTSSRTTQETNARLKIGAAVLAAAEVVDTHLVADRLRAFDEAHSAYLDAAHKIDAADARLETEKRGLEEVGAAHDAAVEQLAVSLVNAGQPRINPFAAFDADTPGAIKRMPPDEAARAVRSLLGTLSRHGGLSAATLAAGAAVEQATQHVEAALVPFQARQDESRAARRMADVVGRRYDLALRALRHAARAAAADGAADLYDTLFPITTRVARKTKPAVAEPPTAPPAPPASPVPPVPQVATA